MKINNNNTINDGVIYIPYIFVTEKTTINNTVVWYRNRIKNMLLKIKFFFYKPKAVKNFEKHSIKPINSKYITKFNI